MKGVLSSLVIGFALGLSRLSSAEIDSNYHLTLFTFPDPPYILRDQEGKEGLVDKAITQLMSEVDVRYSIIVEPTKRAMRSSQATEHSCVYPIEKSQERETQFKWISPILISRHALFQLEGSPAIPLNVLDDAQSYRIGSYLGSETGEYLKSLGFTVDFAAKNKANVQKLQMDRIDFWASDSETAPFIAERDGVTLSPSRLNFFTTLRAIGCHDSVPDELISKLQKALIKMYERDEVSWLNDPG